MLINNPDFFFLFFTERAKWHLPETLVCPEGQPALLPGASSWPTPAGCHRAGGVRSPALGVWWTICLFPGVWGTRIQNLQICSRGLSDSGELGESVALSQPLLPLPAGERLEEAVWRCVMYYEVYYFYISIAIVFYWLFSCYKSVPLLFLLCLFNFFFISLSAL